LLERLRLELLYRGGLSIDEVEAQLAELRAEAEADSRKRLKLMFILARLAEDFEIDVSEQEVNGRIAAIAAQRGERPEKLRAELVQSGAIGQIATQLREHKTADRVIDSATVEEIPLEEWNKLASERQAKVGGKKTPSKKKTTKKTTTKKTGGKKTTTKKKTTKKKTSGKDAAD
jgi:FKBP-type peptidyl-prolyl cis-trans isomerase (trigger factor)